MVAKKFEKHFVLYEVCTEAEETVEHVIQRTIIRWRTPVGEIIDWCTGRIKK
jgi:hypothetical protein